MAVTSRQLSTKSRSSLLGDVRVGQLLEAIEQRVIDRRDLKADLTLQDLQERGKRVAGDQLAVVNDADSAAQGLDFFHVMARVDDRDPFAIEPLDFLEDVISRLRIDADRRLVEQDEVRAVNERGAEVQPPLHAARVGLDPFVGSIGEAHRLEHAVCPLTERRAARP